MKVGRNDPCPCGSGKKYKKCCMPKHNRIEASYVSLSRAFKALTKDILDFAHSKGKEIYREASFEFLPYDEESEMDLENMFMDNLALFTPYYLYHWIYDPDEDSVDLDIPPYKTIAQVYADMHGDKIDPLQRRLIDTLFRTPYSFFEVKHVDQGSGFLLKDIFLDDELYVSEHSGSSTALPGHVIYGSVITVENVSMLSGIGLYLFPPEFKVDILDVKSDLISEMGSLTPQILKEESWFLRELYFSLYRRLISKPTLCNTDGDLLLFHTLYFSVDDPDFAFHKLSHLNALHTEEELLEDAVLDEKGRVVRAEITWYRIEPEGSGTFDNTILGEIVIDHDKLTVDVNSKERAERIRAQIEFDLGKHVTFKLSTIRDIESPALQEELAGEDESGLTSEDLESIPEVQEAVKAFIAKHWDGWSDTKLPALGGSTPRQAVKTPIGREKVASLLLGYEHLLEHDERMRKLTGDAIDTIRRRLGLGVRSEE